MNIIIWFFLIVAMTFLLFSDNDDGKPRKGD
jgi:hypothetical protein